MAKLRAVFATILLAGLVVSTMAGCETASSGAIVRVGTFDSRAVAIAYYRSEAFNSEMRGLQEEHKKAKAEGNADRVKELEALGPAKQALTHKQSFGTWPVDEILEKIEGQITEIAKQAGVDIIVSKWDVVYEGPGVGFVDVTDFLVEPFGPDQMTLNVVNDLPNVDPVPIDQIKEH